MTATAEQPPQHANAYPQPYPYTPLIKAAVLDAVSLNAGIDIGRETWHSDARWGLRLPDNATEIELDSYLLPRLVHRINREALRIHLEELPPDIEHRALVLDGNLVYDALKKFTNATKNREPLKKLAEPVLERSRGRVIDTHVASAVRRDIWQPRLGPTYVDVDKGQALEAKNMLWGVLAVQGIMFSHGMLHGQRRHRHVQ